MKIIDKLDLKEYGSLIISYSNEMKLYALHRISPKNQDVYYSELPTSITQWHLSATLIAETKEILKQKFEKEIELTTAINNFFKQNIERIQ